MLAQLRSFGVPLVALQLAAWVYAAGLVDADGLGVLDGVEFFCGQQAVSKALRSHGLAIFGYDEKHHSVLQDIMTAPGYSFALSLALRIHPAGFVWFGIVCSSWVWISRGTTGRSTERPHGIRSRYVSKHNAMASRVVLLWWICAARCILCCLEQPASSLLQLYSRFQQLASCTRLFRIREWLGYFKAESPMPVMIYSNFPAIATIKQYRTQHTLPTSHGFKLRLG